MTVITVLIVSALRSPVVLCHCFFLSAQEINRLNEENGKLRDRLKDLETKVQ